MSTKLYNGHRMNSMSLNELNEFYKELRLRTKAFFKENYLKLVAHRIHELLISVTRQEYELKMTEEKYGVDSEEYLKQIKYMENILIDIYKKNMSFARLCSETFSVEKFEKELNIDNVLENMKYSHLGSLLNIAIEYVENEARRIQITHERNDSYDFFGEICIMSNNNISGNKVLFLVYGSLLESYFYELLNSNNADDIAFVQKYGIEEYMYYNNTDQPKDISDAEWDLRRQDWEYALPTGVPSDSGFVMDMFNELGYFSDWMFDVLRNKELVGDLLMSTDDIIKKLAYNIINEDFLNKYCDEHNDGETLQYHVVMDGIREFNKLYKSNDSEILEKISNAESKIKSLNILCDCDIINANILDIALTYKHYKEKEK